VRRNIQQAEVGFQEIEKTTSGNAPAHDYRPLRVHLRDHLMATESSGLGTDPDFP
jgi:hypothetical protein